MLLVTDGSGQGVTQMEEEPKRPQREARGVVSAPDNAGLTAFAPATRCVPFPTDERPLGKGSPRAASVRAVVGPSAPELPPGALKEPSEETKRRFGELANRWQRETVYLSSASRMAAHPAYKAIIAMGWEAVPLLIARLRRKPDHWFIALEEITKAQPIPPESEGKVKRMAEAWVKWWEELRREHAEANH